MVASMWLVIEVTGLKASPLHLLIGAYVYWNGLHSIRNRSPTTAFGIPQCGSTDAVSRNDYPLRTEMENAARRAASRS